MDWIQIFIPELTLIFAFIVFPALLVWLFPKTWSWPKLICECKNRVLCLRIIGSFDPLLMGVLIVIVPLYFLFDEKIVVFVPFLLFFKWLFWLIERQQYEFSAAGIRYQKAFSSGFMAWEDVREINIVSPGQRLMFRSQRTKIVIELVPLSQHFPGNFDAPRVAQLIARFARKKLRHRTNILWCT
jgi:hypothetical protein